ncbi:cysteine--tRNA ligase [Candidatus Kaiserbacteria bacterium RIFCSPLOWO2_01_FULL_52_12b]|uniref:Cysteine--tRNA ligase n=1 Tax=Candidatus Kaiserbacteria bacterium RIFCSPLOWO2_01_FULL_52_12b TaxID=1798509 RepID=A0A1F6EXA8_9BACT|nr:MAG: cysteine--tRNA ligase [Candidatus Kaiserbacteria bacterium RIFCSPLOWO2_01_FULL_52_12b]
MFGTRDTTAQDRLPQIFFTNTLSGKKELFISQRPGIATMYSCGPTVYSRQHIGNLRAAVFSDTIARVLKGAHYHVRRVTNITDVGHLVGDDDDGEDKMTVGAKREKTTPEEIANRYTKIYIEDLEDLNIDTDDIQFPRATAYIKEQIALAKTLEEKGFAYYLPDGLYFDTQKFQNYGRLGKISHVQLEAGKRVDVVKGKRHPADFVLWRTAKVNDLQQWNSPWGHGNPGWHIECSAMVRALLGQEIDLHTGGTEHISIHHNNEIAQSEAANGRTFVHYWIHNAHLNIQGEKLAKSTGNAIYLSDVIEKGLHPLSLRYFFLQAHYRTPLSFSWDTLAGAASGLDRLWRTAADIAEESKRVHEPSEARAHFLAALRDDLATPQALGILWESLKSEDYTPGEKWGLLQDAEVHLGLSLLDPPIRGMVQEDEVPKEIKELLARREAVRASKDFKEADRIRGEILNRGYRVDDGPDGSVLTKEQL